MGGGRAPAPEAHIRTRPRGIPAPDGQRQAEHLCLWGRCLETSTAWCLEKSQETGSSQDGAFRHVRGSGGQRRHCRWNHREAA